MRCSDCEFKQTCSNENKLNDLTSFERCVLREHYKLQMKKSEFRKELTNLINKYNQGNYGDAPDWILQRYLMRCLDDFRNNEMTE